METFTQEGDGKRRKWLLGRSNRQLIVVKEAVAKAKCTSLGPFPTPIYPDDTGVSNASCFEHKLYLTI